MKDKILELLKHHISVTLLVVLPLASMLMLFIFAFCLFVGIFQPDQLQVGFKVFGEKLKEYVQFEICIMFFLMSVYVFWRKNENQIQD